MKISGPAIWVQPAAAIPDSRCSIEAFLGTSRTVSYVNTISAEDSVGVTLHLKERYL